MDKIAKGVGLTLLGVGLDAVISNLGSILGWLCIASGVGVTAWGFRELLFPSSPKIKQFSAHNALNLKITNKYDKAGLGGVQLSLHSLQRWRGDRRDFGIAESFKSYTPMVLFADQVDLPYGVPRMFQIVEFKDPSAPFVRGRSRGEQGAVREVPIPSHGIWRANLELRWGGGAKEHVAFFEWNENKLPTFCKKPR